MVYTHNTPSTDDIALLKMLAGPSGWSTDPTTLAPWLEEWRGKYVGSTPIMLAPDSAETLSKIIAYCHNRALAVKTQGGNTGLVGGSTPGLEGRTEILISTRRMAQIEPASEGATYLMAGSGAAIHAVQEAAREAGRLFPLSLASEGSCTVGGTLATNAGGMHVIRYGSMGALAYGVEAVLADGTIIDETSPLMKDNRGIRFSRLLTGSEGTLGIITKASLRLFAPEHSQCTLWLTCPSLSACIDILKSAQAQFGQKLSVFEVISQPALNFALKHFGAAAPTQTQDDQAWHILIELADSDAHTTFDDAALNWFEDLSANALANDAAMATSLAQRKHMWLLREKLSEAQKLEGKSIKHDISLPLEQMVAFHQDAKALIESRWPGSRVTPFGHLGDGNLHYNVMQPEGSNPDAFACLWEDMNDAVHTLVTAYTGSISAEHGIGIMKRSALADARGHAHINAMRAIKSALDPKGILNPGVLFQ